MRWFAEIVSIRAEPKIKSQLCPCVRFRGIVDVRQDDYSIRSCHKNVLKSLILVAFNLVLDVRFFVHLFRSSHAGLWLCFEGDIVLAPRHGDSFLDYSYYSSAAITSCWKRRICASNVGFKAASESSLTEVMEILFISAIANDFSVDH